MSFKISFPREAKRLFDEIQVDLHGVKVIDPEASIYVRYTNTKTGEISNPTPMSVRELDIYEEEGADETGMTATTPIEEAQIMEEPEEVNHSPLPYDDTKGTTN